MKNFDYVVERCNGADEDYYEQKRLLVLETIKPICEAFEISDYDYIIDDMGERLSVEGQEIGCTCNSIGATVRELINYIWIKSGCIDKVYYFRAAVENRLKAYWKGGRYI